ncbi:MAG: polysaccharide deacetylase family protein [Rubrivivax sp.]
MADASAPGWSWPPAIRASVALHALAGTAALAMPGAWPLALGAVALNHLALSAAGLWPRSSALGPNVRRLSPDAADHGAWALTLDDGPDPEVTPAVLDLLAAHGVRATFFCIAEHAAAHPALLRRILAAGHSVQNHSHRHGHQFSMLGPRAQRREIDRAQHVLADIGGTLPHCFRAPAGLRNPFTDLVLHELNLHLVSWTRRGFDTREADPARVLARLIGERHDGQPARLAARDILLLHDGHARRGTDGKPLLLTVLPLLLERCRAADLHAVTLAEALPPRHAAAAQGTA